MALSAAQGLALMRAGFGLYFLVSALRKTTTGWLTDPQPMLQFLQRNGEGMTPGYSTFIDSVVAPNAPLFSQLVVLGEWVAGLSLLLGFLTRLGSIAGMWLLLNFMLAKGLPNFEGSSDRLYFLMCFAFAAAAAGQVWGLDGKLRATLTTNPLTSWLAGIRTPARPSLDPFPERREEDWEERRAA